MLEAGEIIDAVATGTIARRGLTELGRLLVDPPAELSGLTVFKSVGIAIQDWAIARLISERLVHELATATNGHDARELAVPLDGAGVQQTT
jgi:ornithine cyclodeaminase/alanine dehydrogenase-like protein (mu-crystallin family)